MPPWNPTNPAPGKPRIAERFSSLHLVLLSRYEYIDRVAMAVYDPVTDLLKTFCSSNRSAAPLVAHEARLSDVPSLRALAESRKPRVIDDIGEALRAPSVHTGWLKSRGFASSYTVPVFRGAELAAFVFYDSRRPRAFDTDTTAFLDVFSDLAVRFYLAETAAARTLIGSVQVAAELGQVRDLETGMHLTRMAQYSRLIAQRLREPLGLDDEFIEQLHLFAPLHDIGKIGIPDRILLKPGKLDAGEWATMKTHVDIGVRMARHIIEDLQLDNDRGAQVMLDVIGGHHERGDGSGYPAGLRLEAIPLAARIVAIADVYDALSSRRPYKPAWPEAEVLAELRRQAAARCLDPQAVEALLAAEDERREIGRRYADVDFEAPEEGSPGGRET